MAIKQNLKRFTSFLIVFCFLFQGISFSYISEDTYEDFKIVVGDIFTIDANNPTRVAVRDPNLIDIKKVDEKNIIISGKVKGVTTLTVWDKFGEQTYIIKVVPTDIEYWDRQVKLILKNLGLKDVYTLPMEEEGRVLLMGSVKDPQDKERVLLALGDMSAHVTDLIVVEDDALIEIAVEVLELQGDASQKLGFNLPSSITFTELPSVNSDTTQANRISFSEIFRVTDWYRSAFSWTLDFLVQEGKAKILSRPRLVCQSGREAQLHVGGEKPIFETKVAAEGSEGAEVDYKEYGIKLNIKPTVMGEGRIQVGLGVEISEVETAESIGSTSYSGSSVTQSTTKAKAYPLLKRNISTQLYLNDNEMLAIGGLIKKKKEEDAKKVPFLGDLPLIGALFRHKETLRGGGAGERGESELFITLTPRIVADHKPRQGLPANKEKVVDPNNYSDSTLGLDEGEKTNFKADMPDNLHDYMRAVQEKIIQSIRYPESLVGTGWNAQLVVKLNIGYTGELKNAQVTQPSGYKIFDKETIRTVKNLSYEPFPPSVLLREVEVDVPVVYRGKR